MFSLATIQRMNSAREAAKSRRRAVALNNPEGHAKDAEKGRRPGKTKLYLKNGMLVGHTGKKITSLEVADILNS